MHGIDCEKNYYIFFLQIIDINDTFNVRSTISYYNVKHIKDNIYEAEAKGNYLRLVTSKQYIQITENFIAMIWPKLWISSMC